VAARRKEGEGDGRKKPIERKQIARRMEGENEYHGGRKARVTGGRSR
jgi:hypothetical protein